MACIGIIDADLIDHGTRHPNLALMKIAGYLKEKGNDVELIFRSFDDARDPKYDALYMGCVFDFTKVPEEIKNLPNMKVYGGTGFYPEGDGPQLPYEVEHHMPYYDLYKEYVEYEIAHGRKENYFSDYRYYSIGFTSRGCFRKCSFCVNKKYDHAFRHSPVKEFLDESRPYIYLWDDNILALGQWESIIDELESTGKPYQFRQGIDLRLMTDRKAYRLVNAHYHGDFIFAFDHIEDKDIIIEKVQLWKRYSSSICKMYVISAYKSQDEKDIADVFERIKILMQYGSLPYIMRYKAYKQSPYRELYIQLARWCNQPQFFKKQSFREFCIQNQRYKKDQSQNCAAYQAMLDFEEQWPEIAKKYFDLKFNDLNLYKHQYGYGRRYANKPLCSQCKKEGLCWAALLKKPQLLIEKYLTKQVDLQCLTYKNKECNIDSAKVAEAIVDVLLKTSYSEIIAILSKCKKEDREPVTKENIFQYSTREYAMDEVPAIVDGLCYEQIQEGNEQGIGVDQLGKYLQSYKSNSTPTKISSKKYGENHAKFAALLDLVVMSKSDSRAIIRLSEFGKYFKGLPDQTKKQLIGKLYLRIPIIQNYFIAPVSERNDQLEKDLAVLSDTAKNRRRPNVKEVIQFIEDQF